MSTAIIEMTKEEITARAINTNRDELTFENQIFAKGPSFSLKRKEPALKYCQQMAQKNRKSLLIQEKYGFTIWTQWHQRNNQYFNRKDLFKQPVFNLNTQSKVQY